MSKKNFKRHLLLFQCDASIAKLITINQVQVQEEENSQEVKEDLPLPQEVKDLMMEVSGCPILPGAPLTKGEGISDFIVKIFVGKADQSSKPKLKRIAELLP